MAIVIAAANGKVSFTVHVQPRASHDEIAGEYGGSLKIRLIAPPVEDRANKSLRELLAARLNVPLAAVKIVSGEHSRTKRIEIAGVTTATIRALID